MSSTAFFWSCSPFVETATFPPLSSVKTFLQEIKNAFFSSKFLSLLFGLYLIKLKMCTKTGRWKLREWQLMLESWCYSILVKEACVKEEKKIFFSLSEINISRIKCLSAGTALASCMLAAASEKETQLTWLLQDFHRLNGVGGLVCMAVIVAVFVLACSWGQWACRPAAWDSWEVSSERWEGLGPDGCPIQPNDSIPCFPHFPKPDGDYYRGLKHLRVKEKEREVGSGGGFLLFQNL